MSAVEVRVLDAAKACCERWGFEKVTIDDIAAAAGVSRATIYRMFPGGKDVLFEALRVRELEEFFAVLLSRVEGATNLEDLLVRAVVAATAELRADEHLALMLASEPGRTLSELTVEGLPRSSASPPRSSRRSPSRTSDASRPGRSSTCWPGSRSPTSSRRATPSTSATRTRRGRSWPPSSPPTHPRSPVMTVTHRDNDEIIGRDELDDIEAILAVSNQDLDEVEHAVKDNADAMFTWDYSLARPQLRKLYEKAKTGQWNATTDLPWDTEVDLEEVVTADQAALQAGLSPDHYAGTIVEKWDDKQWLEFGIDQRRWTLSQFLHGEQGALLCTAKITETVPWYDAKLYASTQVMDEARHVEVFSRYVEEKLGGSFQINAHLRMLLDDIIQDSRWDMTYLGMQVMVEGLALAAFGYMHQLTEEPLLKQLLRYVMSDEARHVAFGVLSLRRDLRRDDRRRDEGAPGVRLRGRGADARPVPVPGGLGAPRRQPARRRAARAQRPDPRAVPADAVHQDRAQLQEARPARSQRVVAAPPLRGDGRDPVRARRGHGRGVHQVRVGRGGHPPPA